MNKHESNRLNAYNRVLGVLDGNPEFFDGIEVFSSAIEEFRNKMNEIFKIEAEIKRGSKPTVAAKNEIRRKLAEEGAGIANIIALYAYDHQNVELEHDVKYSFTDLYKFREAVFEARIRTILEVAENHAESLKDYQLSKEKLDTFKSLTHEFTALTESAGEAISRRIANNKRSRNILNEIEELITRRIDRIVLSMKMDHPEFYRAYHAARQIVDL